MNVTPLESSETSRGASAFRRGPQSAADLFARLAAGATLVTPNRRQAQHWKARFDAAQAESGLRVWPTADVLPWPAFVVRCFERISHALDNVPVLLSPDQEAVLWDQVIERSAIERGLLSVPQTAAQCRSAWQTAQAWRLWPRLKQLELSEDARAFLGWAETYEAATRKRDALDDARLPDFLAGAIARADRPSWEAPVALLLQGFDLMSPAQEAVLAAFADAGVPVEAVALDTAPGTLRRVECAHPDAELMAAAAWARQCLAANPTARVGVVVPDVQVRRDAVLRRFAAALSPGDALAHPVDISIGLPLSEWPMVHDALAMLDLARGQAFPVTHWSGLLLSPFWTGGWAERSQRARLDAALREDGLAETTLSGFLRRVENRQDVLPTPILVANLSVLSEAMRGAGSQRLTAADWGHHFADWLKLAGFPGERTLDSQEHQTVAKLRSLLESLAALDRVLPRITLADALGRLQRLCHEITFQPDIDTLPVDVLGVLESAGLSFDHLWVSGMTADAWPLAMHAHAFLPLSLQRAAGVPEATPSVTLEIDQRITAGWMKAAAEVVFSHAVQSEDRELLPSPLVRDIPCVPLGEVLRTPAPDWAAACLATRESQPLEVLVDEQAPPLQITGPLSAGTAALRDQSACPFRAMARHRLRAEGLATPQPGLDPATRGTLLHAVLQNVWEDLQDHAGLNARDDHALQACVDGAIARVFQRHPLVRESEYSQRLLELERARLSRLVRAWLEVDRARPAFVVEAMEEKRAVMAGSLPLNVKLDRRDRLQGGPLAGRAVVIDYKSGRAATAQWKGERPDEPQLPLYLLTDTEAVAGLAFALVSPGKLVYKGWAEEDGAGDGIVPLKPEGDESPADAWARQVSEWQRVLDRLGDEFVAGRAAVDPKQGSTCQWCDLHAFCRVADRMGDADEDEETTSARTSGEDA